MRCVRGGDLGVRYRMLSWRGGRRVEDGRSRSRRVGPQHKQQEEAGGVSARGVMDLLLPSRTRTPPLPTPPLLVSVCVCGFSSTYLCGEGGSRGDRDPGDPSDLSDLGLVVVGLHHHSRSTPPPRGGSPLVADLHGPCAPRRRRCLLHHHLDLVLYFDLNSPRPVVSTRTCLDT